MMERRGDSVEAIGRSRVETRDGRMKSKSDSEYIAGLCRGNKRASLTIWVAARGTTLYSKPALHKPPQNAFIDAKNSIYIERQQARQAGPAHRHGPGAAPAHGVPKTEAKPALSPAINRIFRSEGLS